MTGAIITKQFGLSSIKCEGALIPFDYDERTLNELKGIYANAPTFYFEEPFTAEQFEQLAALFQSSSEFFIRDLAESCRDDAKQLRKCP